MDKDAILKLLEAVRDGGMSVDSALGTLRNFPVEEMGFARLDHHRRLRTGMPEVVFGEGKSAQQVAAILESLAADGRVALATRVDHDKAAAVCRVLSEAVYHRDARIVQVNQSVEPEPDAPLIMVVAAGTSDLGVAEEAVITARGFANRVETLYDVGVAGVHRLLSQLEKISSATVIIVVAGMEGALPGVIAGLVDSPVIAVPTSVGYGSGRGGIAALLSMLNSCAPGMAVVNIDNGFGAGCMASTIVRSITCGGD